MPSGALVLSPFPIAHQARMVVKLIEPKSKPKPEPKPVMIIAPVAHTVPRETELAVSYQKLAPGAHQDRARSIRFIPPLQNKYKGTRTTQEAPVSHSHFGSSLKRDGD